MERNIPFNPTIELARMSQANKNSTSVHAAEIGEGGILDGFPDLLHDEKYFAPPQGNLDITIVDPPPQENNDICPHPEVECVFDPSPNNGVVNGTLTIKTGPHTSLNTQAICSIYTTNNPHSESSCQKQLGTTGSPNGTATIDIMEGQMISKGPIGAYLVPKPLSEVIDKINNTPTIASQTQEEERIAFIDKYAGNALRAVCGLSILGPMVAGLNTLRKRRNTAKPETIPPLHKMKTWPQSDQSANKTQSTEGVRSRNKPDTYVDNPYTKNNPPRKDN